jgi:UDP-4-amino-4,6-dideoxy-N-acetyl-beta-L-altrosamine N-acetyltransferase
MEIRGSRVHLRPMSHSDTEVILRWRGDPAVATHLFSERPPTREEHEEFLERLHSRSDRLEFIIVVNEGHVPVGTIGLSHIDRETGEAEYGILIGEEDARGKGVGREASELILDHAFRALGLDRVILNVFTDNVAAIALYRRLGFRLEPHGSTTKEKDGVRRHVARMIINRSEGVAAAS